MICGERWLNLTNSNGLRELYSEIFSRDFIITVQIVNSIIK